MISVDPLYTLRQYYPFYSRRDAATDRKPPPAPVNGKTHTAERGPTVTTAIPRSETPMTLSKKRDYLRNHLPFTSRNSPHNVIRKAPIVFRALLYTISCIRRLQVFTDIPSTTNPSPEICTILAMVFTSIWTPLSLPSELLHRRKRTPACRSGSDMLSYL